MNVPKIYGHRGASSLEPENTMRAFNRAFIDGANGIEFDIRLSADEEIVIIHDETIDRTSNGSGKTKDYTYNELLQWDFGLGERIPLLEDVLRTFGNKKWLNIEIKEIGLEQQLVKILNDLKIREKVIISSFKIPAIKKIKELDTNIETAYIYSFKKSNLVQLKRSTNIDGIHPNHNLVTKKLVKEANSLGLQIRTWTVDNPNKAIKLSKLNVESIITNNPKVIIEALAIKK